jgi:hypothetical protein
MENSMTVTESPSKVTTQAPSSNLNIATNTKFKLRVMDRKQSDGRSPIAKHNLPTIGGRV